MEKKKVDHLTEHLGNRCSPLRPVEKVELMPIYAQPELRSGAAIALFESGIKRQRPARLL